MGRVTRRYFGSSEFGGATCVFFEPQNHRFYRISAFRNLSGRIPRLAVQLCGACCRCMFGNIAGWWGGEGMGSGMEAD